MSRPEQASMALLHPCFRAKLLALIADIAAEKLPFDLFEGYRSPGRQAIFYGIGRGPGSQDRILTKARPWESFHQYGLAADLVIQIQGRWSWEEDRQTYPWWTRMHELAKKHGLVGLPWEQPHVQLGGVTLEELTLGHYPQGGDRPWAQNLINEIAAWRGRPKAPLVPRISGEIA